MRGLIPALVGALLLAPALAAQEGGGLLSRHGDWSLFDPGAREGCFLTSYGIDGAGRPAKAQMFVQLRIGQHPPEEVSFLLPGGFGDGPAQLLLDGTRHEVLTEGAWGWPPVALAHKDVVGAGTVRLEAVDADGRPVALAFSVRGLEAGLMALRTRCR